MHTFSFFVISFSRIHYVNASSKERLLLDLMSFNGAAELQSAISAMCLTPRLLLVVTNINNMALVDLVACLPCTVNLCILLAGTDQLLETLATSGQCWKLGDLTDEVIIKRTRMALAQPLKTRRRVVTLVAKGGTGKTQIATKFAHENRARCVHTLLFHFYEVKLTEII